MRGQFGAAKLIGSCARRVEKTHVNVFMTKVPAVGEQKLEQWHENKLLMRS